MAAIKKTSLSAGAVIRWALTHDEEVQARTRKIFPIVVDNAALPYIAYRRASLSSLAVKNQAGPDTVTIEVSCFTKDYDEGVELAEAVRAALDNKQGTIEDISIRRCLLTDSDETWTDDAYVQTLVFNLTIN